MADEVAIMFATLDNPQQYQAIKAHDPDRARREMGAHLDLARQAQAGEEKDRGRAAGTVRR